MKKKPDEFKAIILAGGSGERFWPLSTAEKPKQFLRVFGGESLLRQSVSRLKGVVKPRNVYIITSRALVPATRRELPEVPPENIVGEPMRRDTGAAVALGVALAGNGVLGFFASDQMVSDPSGFRAALRKAIAATSGRHIVTLGIKPTYPSTGFGYVDPATKRFVEKPNADKAKEYLDRGFLWNAGMFIARSGVFRSAIVNYAPALTELSEANFGDRVSPSRLDKIYESLPKISFDFAVMEPFSRTTVPGSGVEVVPGDFGWDDVGSFAAFDKYFPHDSTGNVREGPCTVVESQSNICVARAARISLLGVKNLVVITTPDSVLVADKSRIADMKKLFKK